ncbi:unnamed protein product [Vitrella brassicaformis CCMP3155]|uniref:Uncharacterized protein n=1 Tax=Vitrella brassicaformis (strain CCMP3155) TaxID=1169540 RepID=A0A0G4F2P7_VITBC|nr:unnamed protein product [Vitrella brassicaformis CCMP3155]|eukprot:CEM06488.1 unnamed protein product [Vitrella brassicaformis CCMP3155]
MGEAARDLLSKADKKLKGGLLSFLSGSSRYDEACELYQQAANQFKLQKMWQDAAEAFIRCAHCQHQLQSATEEANFLMEAASVMRKYSTSDAVEQYNKAVELYSAAGRFAQSAKILKQVAELYEGDGDYERAVQFYRRAADLFEMDDYGKSQLTACMLKIAEYIARYEKKLEEAIQIFEKEGQKALQNSLIQFGAKEHFLKAGILHLATNDAVNAKLAYEKYEAMDPRFGPSREGQLLKAMVEAFEQNNVDQFVEAIHEYDTITKLDAWKTHFLYNVKEQMAPSAPEGEGGEVDLT